MARYRTRQIEIDAVQVTADTTEQIVELLGGPRQVKVEKTILPGPGRGMHDGVRITTIDEERVASVGNWIITGHEVWFRIESDDRFRELYEPVDTGGAE